MSEYENYNKASDSYDTLRHAVGSDVFAGMVPLYCGKPLNELHILDAGCGTGNYAKALLDAGLGHVTMFDASSGMLQKARDKLSAEITAGRVVDINEGRLPTLPYPDSKFDAVIFSLVLHHLQPNPDGKAFPAIDEAISEAKRVVKKDGVIVIATLFPDTFLPLSWFTKFSDTITHRFRDRFPSFDQFRSMFGKNDLRLLTKLDHYAPSSPERAAVIGDPLGPTKKEWRDTYSYWACGTEEDIAEVENKVLKMHNEGTLETFVKENNKMDYFFYLSFLFVTPNK